MLSKAEKTQVKIGSATLGMGLILSLASVYRMEYISYFGTLEITASIALLFGALKAHVTHKPKFMLIWLVMSSIFFNTVLFVVFNYIKEEFRSYRADSWAGLFAIIGAAALVGYMLYIVYNMYVELTEEHSTSFIAPTTARDEDKALPSYDASMHLVVSTHA